MINIKSKCTGCNACAAVCPVNCITQEVDEYGTVYPCIEQEKCIGCNACRRICPTDYYFTYRFPTTVYAAWSKDPEIRGEGASGGIASEIYLYGIKQKFFMMATYFDRTKGVSFKPVKDKKDLCWACNSKYVYSDMSECFHEYEKHFKNGEGCIFIGLPCQVAALKLYINMNCKAVNGNFIFVDIICHGVPNFDYLNQHLSQIERKKKKHIGNMKFRVNSNYNMCLYDKDDNLVYEKSMHTNDVYYRAFAVNLDFRENCYHCAYARNERISDITLGDYSGLGRLWPYEGEKRQVSVVLCMTETGLELLKEMERNDQVKLEKRPLAEPSSAVGNPQLRHPSVPYRKREVFLQEYEKNADFEKSVRKALKFLLVQYYICFPIYYLKRILYKILPQKIKNDVKKMIRK